MRLALVEKHQEIDNILNQDGNFSLVAALGNDMLLKITSDSLWVALKAHARAETLPPLWTSVDRIPPKILAKAGAILASARTIGDVLRDLTGDDDFGQEDR